MDTETYKTENVSVEPSSELQPEEGEKLIGKVVLSVDAMEYGLSITFTDKSCICVEGSRWGDCSLGINFVDGD